MVSIVLRNLSKSFGDTIALDHVSLKIEPGELFFLLGPSGCGKTTLLRTIAGFYRPESGSILFDNKDVTYTPAHKRNTAMMFQSYALWPHMTVAKNVAFGLEERKVPKPEIEEKVQAALEGVRMEDYPHRKINELSGGQQQRVALARALVVRPQCLLLDEPLSNLDAKLRLEMRTEIRRICKDHGLTTVYVTHDQKEALSIADRMAILDRGRIAQVGTPQGVYRTPHSSLVANFIGETNLINGVLGESLDEKGYYEIDTPFGLFVGRITEPQWDPVPGTSVTIAVRPECFILRVVDPKRNRIPGNVTRAMYLGEIAQYHVKTSNDTNLLVSELNPPYLRDDKEEQLFACVNREDTIILRKRTRIAG